MLFWMWLFTVVFDGISYEEVDYPITPDNFLEYQGLIPDRIYDSYKLAVSEPSILQPCDSTIWYLGDNMIVSWQGGALFERVMRSLLIDSVHVTFPQPIWYYVMELYQNGNYIETISPQDWRNHSEPLYIESLDTSRSHSYSTKLFPLVEIGEFIEDNTPGYGFQVRMLIWDKEICRGNIDDVNCIELWSECFRIEEPWLEVVTPNASTIWREDSSDVYVEFISHGLFGYNSPESISPRILLFQGNEEIRPFYVPRSFTQSGLDNNAIVDGRWGNGTEFRICLEMDGERFFSNYFSIFGQTIRILHPASGWLICDPTMKIEWCSLTDSRASINLYGLEVESPPSSGATASIELYGVDRTNLSRYILATLAYDVQNDGLFYYGKSLNKEWLEEHFQLKIVDCDGNYGWSELFIIDQGSRIWNSD